MLKRKYRLRHRADIQRLYRSSHQAQTAAVTLKSHPNHLQHLRLAVVVSSKISKKAVVRNRIRRRVVGIIENYWEELTPGYDLVVIARRDISREPLLQLQEHLGQALHELGLREPINLAG